MIEQREREAGIDSLCRNFEAAEVGYWESRDLKVNLGTEDQASMQQDFRVSSQNTRNRSDLPVVFKPSPKSLTAVVAVGTSHLCSCTSLFSASVN